MTTIKVSNGYVEGHRRTVLGRNIVEFLSIPYCLAPIGDRRFKRPQVATFTDGIINQDTFKSYPPQMTFKAFGDSSPFEELLNPSGEQSEDSLYLNIWCPENVLEGDQKSAVFVWIYGGGFVSGSSSLAIYNGSLLAAQENIIVVNFNYRVAMLGFLCLDDDISGNQGIWDQVLALAWINQNIASFKGDPGNVTLAGNSAGGASVTLHLLIEESWNYFQKVIIQSGVCLSDWAFLPKSEIMRRSEKAVNYIMEKNNLSLRWNHDTGKEDKEKILNELHRVNFKEFLVDPLICEGFFNGAWTPCVDGFLIKDQPQTLFSNKKFKICPSIFLNVANEGTLFFLLQFPKMSVDENDFVDSKYVNECFQYYPHFPHESPSSVKEMIISKYRVSPDKVAIGVLDQMVADKHFVSDSVQLANYVSGNGNNVYYLWFKTPPSSTFLPHWVGTMHVSEVYHLFGFGQSANGETVDESCKEYMRVIGHFIANGSLPKEMPIYEADTGRYMQIVHDQWTPGAFTEDQWDKFHFWHELKLEYR